MLSGFPGSHQPFLRRDCFNTALFHEMDGLPPKCFGLVEQGLVDSTLVKGGLHIECVCANWTQEW